MWWTNLLGPKLCTSRFKVSILVLREMGRLRLQSVLYISSWWFAYVWLTFVTFPTDFGMVSWPDMFNGGSTTNPAAAPGRNPKTVGGSEEPWRLGQARRPLGAVLHHQHPFSAGLSTGKLRKEGPKKQAGSIMKAHKLQHRTTFRCSCIEYFHWSYLHAKKAMNKCRHTYPHHVRVARYIPGIIDSNHPTTTVLIVTHMSSCNHD